MHRVSIKRLLLLISVFTCLCSAAQTEFPNEFSMHVKLGSGAVTKFNNTPDRFAGSLQAIPQYTIKPQAVRGGVVAGLIYVDKKIAGVFGPTVSVQLKELRGGYFGSLGNIHLNVEQLWGTGGQRLAGGGINLELLNKLMLGLSTHRDYKQHDWWFQTAVSFRISKVKTPAESFPH